ncbi:hypothetical protein ACK1M2_002592 [Providencia rettgeri]
MYGLDNQSGVNAMPALAPVKSPTPLWFTEGGSGLAPSYPGQDWFNMVQAEMLGVLTKGGVKPEKGKLNQLAEACSAIVASYSYSKTESNLKFQPAGNYAPAGDYATNTALTNGLNQKLSTSSVTQSTGKSTDKVMSQNAATQAFMQFGSLGFGGEAINVPSDTGYNGITQTSVVKGSGVLGTPDGDLAWGAVLHLQREQGRATQVGFWKGNIGLRSQLAGVWDADWIFAYTQANTSKDPSGFVRASGAAIALTTNNVSQGTGSSTANVISQKAATDAMMGVGQSWSDVTSQRLSGTVYTNSSSKAISVSITLPSTASSTYLEVTVNGVLISNPSASGGGSRCCITFIVPPGARYKVVSTGATISNWSELR